MVFDKHDSQPLAIEYVAVGVAKEHDVQILDMDVKGSMWDEREKVFKSEIENIRSASLRNAANCPAQARMSDNTIATIVIQSLQVWS